MHMIIITASLLGYRDAINLFGAMFFYFFCWIKILFFLLWLECYVKVETMDHPEIQLGIVNHLPSCASDTSSLTDTIVAEKSSNEQVHFFANPAADCCDLLRHLCGKDA